MKNVVKAIERGIVKGAIWIYCKIVYRFKVVGKDNIPDDIAKQIKNVLQKEQKENVLADEALMPAWIRTFTRQAYE